VLNSIYDAPLGTLLTLKELCVECNYIRDISAVAYLINLKIFNFHNNDVTSIEPLRNLPKLEYLDCSRNKIETLEPLGSLPNLKKLNCSRNEIETLEPLEYLRNLNTLYAYGNYFWNIRSLISLDKLEKISLRETYEDEIDLVSFKGFPENANIGVTSFSWWSGYYLHEDEEKTREILEISGTSKFAKIKSIFLDKKRTNYFEWMRMEDLVTLYQYF